MGTRDSYTAGTFCWTDLTTTDQDAAKAFYASVFGWEATDLPIGDGAAYSIQRVDGRDVAAISPQPQQQRDAGVPPVWNSYVWVHSADDTAARASELGGTVHAPPFDVMDAGRMAVIQDPQGAFFMAWQPNQHRGAGLVNAPGALCWNELATSDLDASRSFYGDLFGWTTSPFENSPMPYFIIQNGDRGNGGMREPQPGEPPHWMVFFATDDIDRALGSVAEGGGRKLMDPTDIGIARIAAATDPQGAVFSLYQGELQD